jgi:type VI secretion system FHA domain protein
LLPDDFDPLGSIDATPPSHSSHARTQSDHSSVLEDAFRPPGESGQIDFHAGGVIPGAAKISDDWADDLLEGIGGPIAAQAEPMAFTPPPVVEAPRPAPAQPVLAPEADAFPAIVPIKETIRAASPAPSHDVSPFLEPGDSVETIPPTRPALESPLAAWTPPSAAAPAPPPAGDKSLIVAFMVGVGLPDAMPKDPGGTMRALGAAFRAMVTGVRSILIARASIKSEFRIEQTMIRASGNNPLKFSADDDDALSALLGVGRRMDITPGAAVADALRDIRLHELASMAAMQSAARAMLNGFDPAGIRAVADQGGGMSVLPAQKKARAWDAFEALHRKTLQALNDDFDSVFGKAFARAYEEAMHEISMRDKK